MNGQELIVSYFLDSGGVRRRLSMFMTTTSSIHKERRPMSGPKSTSSQPFIEAILPFTSPDLKSENDHVTIPPHSFIVLSAGPGPYDGGVHQVVSVELDAQVPVRLDAVTISSPDGLSTASLLKTILAPCQRLVLFELDLYPILVHPWHIKATIENPSDAPARCRLVLHTTIIPPQEKPMSDVPTPAIPTPYQNVPRTFWIELHEVKSGDLLLLPIETRILSILAFENITACINNVEETFDLHGSSLQIGTSALSGPMQDLLGMRQTNSFFQVTTVQVKESPTEVVAAIEAAMARARQASRQLQHNKNILIQRQKEAMLKHQEDMRRARHEALRRGQEDEDRLVGAMLQRETSPLRARHGLRYKPSLDVIPGIMPVMEEQGYFDPEIMAPLAVPDLGLGADLDLDGGPGEF